MKTVIFCALAFLSLGSVAKADHWDDNFSRYTFCGIGDRNPVCVAAAHGDSRFRAEGCIGAYGEGGAAYPSEENIYFTYVQYGYQQRPRRNYNDVRRPTFYYTADSYDWACIYAAVRRVW